MRRNYGYGSYRGRSGFRTALKVVIAFLAVALVLLLAGYFLLQRYAVVTDEGVFFDIPFFRGKDAPPADTPPATAETPPVVVVTPTPTPPPEPTEEPIYVVSLPHAALTDGTALQQVQAAGGTAALFDMKADDGSLGYVSQIPLAKTLRTSGSDLAANAAIQALTAGELYTVARVSCFRDNNAPYRNNALSLKTRSGYNWKDTGGSRWMCPTVPEVRAYVAQICVELAALGFDEILLDHAAYPVSGRTETIRRDDNYREEELSAVVEDFYRAVEEALAGYPEVKLSIVTAETVLDGTDLLSGQTVETLVDHAARIWLPQPEEGGADAARLLTAAGLEDVDANLVYYAAQAGAEAQSWAIFP